MTEQLGAYIHVPFCAQRCDYCAFVTYTDAGHLHRRYVEAVLLEAGRVIWDRPVTSLFFGGGTPSQLEVDFLAELIGVVPLASGAEVTVEMNPEDVAPSRLKAMVDAGVTRVSVGIQSTAPHVLADLGRTHRGAEVRELCEMVASAGFATWSMDLIAGSTAEHDEDLARSISDVLDHEAPPPHVSCYLLSLERGTPLSRDPSRHPDDDVLARRYELLDAELGDRGYEWYEVSNFAKPGDECVHNRLYWDQGDYVGLGPAAHGHRSGRRSWNIASLTAYLDAVERGERPEAGHEVLDEPARRLEALSLALRTRRGVDSAWVLRPDGLGDLVVEEEGRLVLTLRGRLLADAVLASLEMTPEVAEADH